MTVRFPRLPIGADPLIAEANRRAWRRRLLAALCALVLAGLAAGLALGLRPSGAPDPGFSAPEASVRAGDLVLTVPRAFHRYAIRGGPYRVGTRPPVTGYVITDYPMHAPTAHNPGGAFEKWAGNGYPDSPPKLPPANEVALQLDEAILTSPRATPNLHLPLSLNQPWAYQELRDGGQGYRFGLIGYHHQLYRVLLWSGGAAPARDRAAILKALASIRPPSRLG